MRILLNSDVLHTTYLLTNQLPPSLEALCRACFQREYTIVLPLTALLEFQRNQAKLADQEIKQIKNAYRTLDKFKVTFERVDPADRVKPLDLPEVMRGLGVQVEVIDPTIEDYTEAHRRACLHEKPQPPETETDEMRDLVIWMIAIRVARTDGGAILVSRDEVHAHARGNDEAGAEGLLRFESFDKVLEHLGVEFVDTPVGNLARQLLEPIWDILQERIPLARPMRLLDIKDASFIQGDRGPSVARFRMKAVGTAGDLESTVVIQTDRGRVTQVALSDIKVNSRPSKTAEVVIATDRPLADTGTPYEERLKSLREALK